MLCTLTEIKGLHQRIYVSLLPSEDSTPPIVFSWKDALSLSPLCLQYNTALPVHLYNRAGGEGLGESFQLRVIYILWVALLSRQLAPHTVLYRSQCFPAGSMLHKSRCCHFHPLHRFCCCHFPPLPHAAQVALFSFMSTPCRTGRPVVTPACSTHAPHSTGCTVVTFARLLSLDK